MENLTQLHHGISNFGKNLSILLKIDLTVPPVCPFVQRMSMNCVITLLVLMLQISTVNRFIFSKPVSFIPSVLKIFPSWSVC